MLKKYFKYMRKNAVQMRENDILQLLEINNSAKILDIGCNDGLWSKKIAQKIGSENIYGLEIVDEAILQAKKNGIKVSKGDISDRLPFDDNTFEVIHSNQVIEHLFKTEHFVKEIYRVLKPNGYVIVCTENLASWHNIFALLMGWMPFSSSNFSQVKWSVGNPFSIHHNESMKSPESWQHIRVLSIRGMKDIFELHGFKTENILGSGYYPFPKWFARLDKTHSVFITGKFRKSEV